MARMGQGKNIFDVNKNKTEASSVYSFSCSVTVRFMFVQRTSLSALSVYPKADVICDEVKVSALSKLEQIIEEKHREEEWVTVVEKNEKSAMATSMSFSRERMARKEKQAMLKRLTVQSEHGEEFEIAVAEEARERMEAWQQAEQKEFAELQAFEAVEKKRTMLVNQLHAKRHQEQAKKMDKLIEEAGLTEQIRRDEHRLKQEVMDKIMTQQQKFRAIFSQISEMLKSFPYREDMIAAVSPSVATMKGLNE
ncbi:hypothetical protein B566_EDAN011750, partial [Ephemera danica]